jgi:hypothetical protein
MSQDLSRQLAAADDAYTAAIQAAVSNHGSWADVQQAHQAVKQCRSALQASEVAL